MHLQYITCMYELRKIFLRNMLFIKGGYSSECIADKGQISGHPLVRVFIGRGGRSMPAEVIPPVRIPRYIYIRDCKRKFQSMG